MRRTASVLESPRTRSCARYDSSASGSHAEKNGLVESIWRASLLKKGTINTGNHLGYEAGRSCKLVCYDVNETYKEGHSERLRTAAATCS